MIDGLILISHYNLHQSFLIIAKCAYLLHVLVQDSSTIFLHPLFKHIAIVGTILVSPYMSLFVGAVEFIRLSVTYNLLNFLLIYSRIKLRHHRFGGQGQVPGKLENVQSFSWTKQKCIF